MVKLNDIDLKILEELLGDPVAEILLRRRTRDLLGASY